MPAFSLSQQSQMLARLDVVGQHAENVPQFVKHIALHNAAAREARHGEEIVVVHMGPPLQIDGRINAHVAGTVPLDLDEISQIEVWFEKIKDEYQRSNVAGSSRKQYVIHPPWHDQRDSITEVRRYRRYSCAGFVLDAHRQVDIDLLDTRDSALPPIGQDVLHAAYCEPSQQFNRNRLARLGIVGNPPWRIVLAGYVLHALARPTQEIRTRPYAPQSGDELF